MKKPCRVCGRETNNTFCSKKCILEYNRYKRRIKKLQYNKIKKLREKNDKRMFELW